MESGIYIYGVIRTKEPQKFGPIGMSSQAPLDVFTLGFRDIAAVVSNRPLTLYQAMSKEDVIKDLVIHQYVIEQVMKRFTILPVKFGTMVKTAKAVKEFLESGYPLINDELRKAEGNIELDVVAWWEIPKMLTLLSQRNEQIRALQQRIADQGVEGEIEDKIALGQAIEQELRDEKVRYQQFILNLLKQEAIDVCMHELATDEMILNASFLLAKENEERFQAAIQTGDQQLESRINFRVVGPLPPYSFATIFFKRFEPEEIESAKKVLGLTGEITSKTLREAYHQGAWHYHPDTTGDETSEEFQALRDAHETLKEFIAHGWIYTEVCRWKRAEES